MTEHEIQNDIRLEAAPYATLFRVNVGSGFTKDGRYFNTGVPSGFSDLFGVRKSDGRAVFIEVKTPKGRPTDKQINFINRMKEHGAIITRLSSRALRIKPQGTIRQDLT